MGVALVIGPDIPGGWLKARPSAGRVTDGGPVDRSEAATTLLAWELEGRDWRSPPGAAEGDLVALATALAARRPRPPDPVPRLPPPPVDFLDLDEEKAVADLRARIRALASGMTDEDRRRSEEHTSELQSPPD